MNPRRGSPVDLTDLELSELARAGYLIVQQPFTDIAFRVFHQRDEPGLLLRTLTSEVTDADREHTRGDPARPTVPQPGRGRGALVQTLATAANEISLIVGTSALPLDNGFRARDGVREDRDGRWSGRSRTNPTFLYDSASLIEGVIVLTEQPPLLTVAYTNLLAKVLRKVSQAAYDRGMPILTLQAPAHVPIGDRTWARTVGGAVRFAVAVRRLDVSKRVDFLKKLVEFCTEQRLALWVRDPSLTARTGNWIPVEIPNSTSFNTAGERIPRVLCTTIVGPARTGSSAAILSCLSHVKGIGVAACSISALSDLAFIHLQLTGSFRQELGMSPMYVDQFLDELPAWVGTPNPWRNPVHADAGKAFDEVAERAKHYRCMFGPPALQPATAETSENETKPVWVSWQLSPRDELTGLLNGLNSAMKRIVDDGTASPGYNIEYLISRGVGDAGVRGRAKLSVPMTVIENAVFGDDEPTQGKEFCSLLENLWRSELEAERDALPTELTVSWREYWLGHWAVEL